MTNTGSGYLMFGNGNRDLFNVRLLPFLTWAA